MNRPSTLSTSRYLTSKRSVDDRALNQEVWELFLEELAQIQPDVDFLQILEVGGGVGATVVRLAKAMDERAIESINYTLVDVASEQIEAARQKLPIWGREAGFEVWTNGSSVEMTGERSSMSVQLIEEDAYKYADQVSAASFNAVIAQAWLDLTHVKTALREFHRITTEGGLLYLPIHFDGQTTFLPSLDAELDESIERLYHARMDRKSTAYGLAGGSQTGRRLLTLLPEVGASVVAAGSSDWIVLPQNEGYPSDEAYFLNHILQFIEYELSGSSEITQHRLDEWLERRRSQIDDGKLIYIAHQLDVLAKTDS